MGWACKGVHKELRNLECWRTRKNSEYLRLLGGLHVSYTDAIANVNGNNNGDCYGEQRVEDMIIVAEFRQDFCYDWGFHPDYWAYFR
jgi:hypothetical protein